MKKLFFALSAALMLSLASCGGVDSKIDEVIALQTELNKLTEQGTEKNQAAIDSIQKLIAPIVTELESAELTDDQVKKLKEAGVVVKGKTDKAEAGQATETAAPAPAPQPTPEIIIDDQSTSEDEATIEPTEAQPNQE